MKCEIVIVDDDPDFAATLSEVLEDEGFAVQTFPTPEGAFEWLLSSRRTSLVLLDLRTPGMSAQRFRALLMSASDLRDLPVVLVSGDPNIHTIASAMGANAALEKPIDLEELLETVARYCGDQRLEP
jgi:DNA-binding NtrC family response regulator